MIHKDVAFPEHIERLIQPGSDEEIEDRFLALGWANEYDRNHGTALGAEVVRRLMYRADLEFEPDDEAAVPEVLWTIEHPEKARRIVLLVQAIGQIIGARVNLYERLDKPGEPKRLAELTHEGQLLLHSGEELAKDHMLERASRYPDDVAFPIRVARLYSASSTGENFSAAMRAMTYGEQTPEPPVEYDE